MHFLCFGAWSNHHIFQTLLWKKMQNITILRSLACFSLKLYISLAANGSTHILQHYTFYPWRLHLCSATKWLKKSLCWLFYHLKKSTFIDCDPSVQKSRNSDKKWSGLSSWGLPAVSFNSMLTQIYHRIKGKTLRRSDQVKVQRFNSQAMEHLPL